MGRLYNGEGYLVVCGQSNPGEAEGHTIAMVSKRTAAMILRTIKLARDGFATEVRTIVQNAKNMSTTTECHRDKRRKSNCDPPVASDGRPNLADMRTYDIVAAALENLEVLKGNWPDTASIPKLLASLLDLDVML